MHTVEAAKLESIAVWAYTEGRAFGLEFRSFDDAMSASSGQRIRAGRMYFPDSRRERVLSDSNGQAPVQPNIRREN
jgi:hypothetical protein